MKCTTVIDKLREEEVIIYSHCRSAEIEKIESFVSSLGTELTGYIDRTAVKLELNEIHFFTVDDGKVYAFTQTEKYLIRLRLYKVEEMLNQSFVKINQSCIANIRKIKRFDAAFSGAMRITFKNGCTDYVSRRQLKTVKERIGL